MEHSVNEVRAVYGDDVLVRAAELILSERVFGRKMGSPDDAVQYINMRLASEEREHFMVMFLSSQNVMIAAEIMFSGTVAQTSVHPREVVKRALQLNASSVIFAHNHPSGFVTPSRADESLTTTLKNALALVDVRVLDHIIVARGAVPLSFAKTGLL